MKGMVNIPVDITDALALRRYLIAQAEELAALKRRVAELEAS